MCYKKYSHLISLLLIAQFIWSAKIFAERSDDYSIFYIKELTPGKNVTVGRFVLSCMSPAERVKIRATNQRQFLEIHLHWLSARADKNKEITGRWLSADKKLYIGIKDKKGIKSIKAKKENIKSDLKMITSDKDSFVQAGTENSIKAEDTQNNGLILIKNIQNNSVSVPLKTGSHILIYPDSSLIEVGEHIQIQLSSNYAYEIAR